MEKTVIKFNIDKEEKYENKQKNYNCSIDDNNTNNIGIPNIQQH